MGTQLEKCQSKYKVNENIIVHKNAIKLITGSEATTASVNYGGPEKLKIKLHQVKNNKWRMVSVCGQSYRMNRLSSKSGERLD